MTAPVLTSVELEHGVEHVTCRVADWPDAFVLVVADLAASRWFALADIVVHGPEPTLAAALAVAAASTRCSSGCSLVAVGVPGHGSVIRFREGRVGLCPGDGSRAETVRSAILGYVSNVLIPP